MVRRGLGQSLRTTGELDRLRAEPKPTRKGGSGGNKSGLEGSSGKDSPGGCRAEGGGCKGATLARAVWCSGAGSSKTMGGMRIEK